MGGLGWKKAWQKWFAWLVSKALTLRELHSRHREQQGRPKMENGHNRRVAVIVRKRGQRDPRHWKNMVGCDKMVLGQGETKGPIIGECDMNSVRYSDLCRQLAGEEMWQCEGPRSGECGIAIGESKRENEQLRALVRELTLRNQVLIRRLAGAGWNCE